MAEVKEHASSERGIWVVYKDGVYDITDFIEAHPGGVDKISLAAGGSVEPFWRIYTQHNSAMVLDILHDLRIGTLHPADVAALKDHGKKEAGDPFEHDSERHPALLVRSSAPFNAETPPALLLDHFHTPNDLFYVRNHLPVPKVDRKTFTLTVTGKGMKKPLTLNVDQLKSKFKHYKVSSAVQCAGNRRKSLDAVKSVHGLMWDGTAMGNAEWTGVRLKDVLAAAGVDPTAEHVLLEGADTDPLQVLFFPQDKPKTAMSPETLIAFDMNGQPLPLDHGAPLRAIVPGVVGARQVKWLNKITVSDSESVSHWQAKDYRMFGPTVTAETVDYKAAPAIQEGPVQSAILSPPPGAKVLLESGEVELGGYAWSGGGRGIVRVELSVDGGRTWAPAELSQAPGQERSSMWAWTLWSATLPLPKGVKAGERVEVWCKATDASCNAQPDSPQGVWNFRGLLNNSWHRLPLNIV